MINAIISGILKFIGNVIGILYTPIDLVISNAFPDFANSVSTFNTMLDTLFYRCSRALGNIFGLFPPNTKNAVILYLSILAIIFSVSLTIHAIIKIIEIIKSIKIW